MITNEILIGPLIGFSGESCPWHLVGLIMEANWLGSHQCSSFPFLFIPHLGNFPMFGIQWVFSTTEINLCKGEGLSLNSLVGYYFHDAEGAYFK